MYQLYHSKAGNILSPTQKRIKQKFKSCFVQWRNGGRKKNAPGKINCRIEIVFEYVIIAPLLKRRINNRASVCWEENKDLKLQIQAEEW